ncbi:MFS transporter [Kineococcus endophyticus]|uniref:MFS transporter n=1 Tax=Kineococcus endophyticus TaxID=1181883 RepID=A0ABV3P1S4_9ACTN
MSSTPAAATAAPDRSALWRPRVAVVGLFLLTGLALATWVVNIPGVQERLGISHGVLGGLLLLLGAGSVVAMQASGPLVDRVGSRPVAAVGAVLLVVGVLLPGLATVPWHLGAALFVLGLGNGAVDVAMNEQAVVVERAWGRPIMSSFHAFFSVGGALGAGLGAVLQAAGLALLPTLAVGAVVVAVLALVSLPFVLTRSTGSADPAPENPAAVPTAPRPTGRLLALALMAFLLMLAEGTANDWSALQAVEDLGRSAASASLAYAAFAVAMTAGRFAADPVAHRFGPVSVVRVGSALAAVGMLVVVLSPTAGGFPLTLPGWVVFGLGLSGIVPQIFTAAGNLGVANPGVTISRVVSAGYVGLLAGPAVIGWLAGGVGLTTALVLPLVFCGVGIALAGAVAPRAADRGGVVG